MTIGGIGGNGGANAGFGTDAVSMNSREIGRAHV